MKTPTARPQQSTPHPDSTALDPIPLILPRQSLSFVAGASGSGKTALLARLLKDLRDGRPIFGHQPNPVAGIGVIAADRGWAQSAGPWFDRVGFADVPYYAMCDDHSFDPRSLRKRHERTWRLMDMVDKLKLPSGSVILIDPIGLFLGGNLIDYDTCAIACHELRGLTRDRDYTLLGAAHSSKMKANKRDRFLRPQDAILGSAALFGYGDTQMYLAAPDELKKPYYAFLWNSHLSPPETFLLQRDPYGLFEPYDGSDNGTRAQLLALLPDDGTEMTLATLCELAEAVPLSRATVKRVIILLVEDEVVEKVRHGVYRKAVLH